MGKTYEELMAQLSPDRRARVEARTAELIAEEKSLRDLRQARQLTQQHMAKKLGTDHGLCRYRRSPKSAKTARSGGAGTVSSRSICACEAVVVKVMTC